MAAQGKESKQSYLAAVLAISFVLGMVVAVCVYLLWREHAISPQYQSLFAGTALMACPPFILSVAIGPAPSSDLEWGLLVGTMVFGNGFLYAGVAAGMYAAVTLLLLRPRRRRQG